ncbi:MAG: DUF4367 domain-containing protein [Tissierellaceae bacterium]
MNKDQVNDLVFEALFRQAVIDNFKEKIDSIPTNEELIRIHTLSQEFEIKMKKLLIKDHRRDLLKKTILYSKRVVSVLIIVLGLLFSTLFFNTEVRATVGKVLLEWYEKFTSFTINNEEPINEKKDWTLNYLPEGYTLSNHEELGLITNIEFTNSQGEIIRFSYQPEDGTTNISVDNENHQINRCEILNNEAYCILAIDDKFDNGLIWNNIEMGVIK